MRLDPWLAGGVSGAIAIPLLVLGLGLPLPFGIGIGIAVTVGVALMIAPQRLVDLVRGGRGSEALKALLADAEPALDRLEVLARAYDDPHAREKVAHIAATVRATARRLLDNPSRTAALAPMFVRYLPMALTIAEGHRVLEERSIRDRGREAETGRALAELDLAFSRYADSFSDEALTALDVELKMLRRTLENEAPALERRPT